MEAMTSRSWMVSLVALALASCSSSTDEGDAGRDGSTDANRGDGNAVVDRVVDQAGGEAAGDTPVVDVGDATTGAGDAGAGADVASDVGEATPAPCAGLCWAVLPIDPSHLVYDASRARLYASVPGGAARYPNTIAVIDPKAAAVTASIPVGSDPGALALSDDSSTLWVGVDGAFSLRKVVLTSSPPTVGPLRRIPPRSRRPSCWRSSWCRYRVPPTASSGG